MYEADNLWYIAHEDILKTIISNFLKRVLLLEIKQGTPFFFLYKYFL